MYIDTVTIGEEWVALSSLMTVGDAPVYIQNRGSLSGQLGVLRVCEGNEAPDADAGDIVLPAQRIYFQKGEQDLYLKSENGQIKINISTGE